MLKEIDQAGSTSWSVLPDFAQGPYDPKRFAEMLLGVAIGDGLGNTSEGLVANHRRDDFGWISEYQPNAHANHVNIGLPSDDTQQSYWLLEHLLEHQRLNPRVLAETFAKEKIFGIGRNAREMKDNLESGIPWFEAGGLGLGNGAMMRIAPILYLVGRLPVQDILASTVNCARISHRHPVAIASAIAWLHLLDHALRHPGATGLELTHTFNNALKVNEPMCPEALRGGSYASHWTGRLSEFVEETVLSGTYKAMTVEEFGDATHSGAYLFETVPTVLFILIRHDGEPERAILEAVNSTVDNDTIASLVASVSGAQHGRDAFRRSWVTNLSGRTTFDDDGQVQTLLSRLGN